MDRDYNSCDDRDRPRKRSPSTNSSDEATEDALGALSALSRRQDRGFGLL